MHDDRALFELLVLEGAQAGLSWSTILRKREGYRRAFAGFDPRAVARFDAAGSTSFSQDAGIVRNRLKVESAVANAPLLDVQDELGSFAASSGTSWTASRSSNGWRARRDPGRDAQYRRP